MGMKLLLFSEYWVLGCVHMPQGITYATGHYIGGGGLFWGLCTYVTGHCIALGGLCTYATGHCIGGFVYICHRALH